MNSNYKNIISETLKNQQSEYKEIRIEESISTRINYSGVKRENISINSQLGGSVRSMANGGWGFSSFNDISKAPEKMKESIELAKYNTNPSFEIYKNNPVKVEIKPVIKKDPRSIKLKDKIDLLDHYKDIILSQNFKQIIL